MPSLADLIFKDSQFYFDAHVGVIIVDSNHLITHFSPSAARIWGLDSAAQVEAEIIGHSVNCLMPKAFWERHKEWIANSQKNAAMVGAAGTGMGEGLKPMTSRGALPIDAWDGPGSRAHLQFQSFTDGKEIISLVVATAAKNGTEEEGRQLVSTFSSFLSRMTVDIDKTAAKTEAWAASVKKMAVALGSVGAILAGAFISVKTFVVNTFKLGTVEQTQTSLNKLEDSAVAKDLKSVANRISLSANGTVVRAFLIVYAQQNNKHYSVFRKDYQWTAQGYSPIEGAYSIEPGVDFERFTQINKGRCYLIDTQKLDPFDAMRSALESSGARGQIICQVKSEKLLGGLAIEYSKPFSDPELAQDLLQIEAARFSRKRLDS